MTPLPSRYAVRDHQLAIGIEPVDALRGQRVMTPLRMTADRLPLTSKVARMERHDSGLHAIRYQPDLPLDRIAVRLFDAREPLYSLAADRRRYVPRRLEIPFRTAVQADVQPAAHRIRRPRFFPGAAYPISDTATGVRARVMRGASPLRWCRVEARVGAELVGRAHGDDRGEFLLIIQPEASGVGDFLDPFDVAVRVYGRAANPVPPSPETPSIDPLWDVPLEVLPAPGAPDPVSTGDQLPAGYVELAARDVNLTLGRLRGGEPDFAV
jgi:hypothetical protein